MGQAPKEHGNQPDVVIQYIQTRTSPKPLVFVIDKMTLRQRQVVSEMGFKSILCMDVEEIPGALALYVVNSLDSDHMCIRTPAGEIPINRRSVHKVLGLPLGTIEIVDDHRAYYSDRISIKWKNHMGLKGGTIRTKHVANRIVNDRSVGYYFKLDFLVLLVTTLVGGTKTGTVNQRFLPSITRHRDVKDLDWCRYVVDAVRTCKVGWIPNNNNSYFIGPITYLVLLYCDAMGCEIPRIQRTHTVVIGWHSEHMMERQTFELRHRGLELLAVNEDYHNNEDAGDANPDEDMNQIHEDRIQVSNEIQFKQFL